MGPARQVLWGHKSNARPTPGRQDVEADVFVADVADDRLRFIIEAKRWERPLDMKAIDQTLRYLDDVAAHRALLTMAAAGSFSMPAGVKPCAHTGSPQHWKRRRHQLVSALRAISLPSQCAGFSAASVPVATPASADLDQLPRTTRWSVTGCWIGRSPRAHRSIFVDAGRKVSSSKSSHRAGHRPINAADPLKPDLYAHELETLGVSSRTRADYVAGAPTLAAQRTPRR